MFNCFQVIEQTQFCDRPMDGQMYRQELQLLLSSAHHLKMLYISMIFRENILNSFQVTEWTQFVIDRQIKVRGGSIYYGIIF